MNLDKYISNQSDKFKAGGREVQALRDQWSPFADRATSIFENAIKSSNNAKMFENLYIDDSRQANKESRNMNRIGLFWGQHPTGEIEADFDPIRMRFKKNMKMEKHGALLFFQITSGQVGLILHPIKSDNLSRDEKDILVKIYDKPCVITEATIVRAVKYFFIYSQCSSFIGHPSLRERLILRWLLFMDLRNRQKVISTLVKDMYDWLKRIVPPIIAFALGYYLRGIK
jgi:hypothetical protein